MKYIVNRESFCVHISGEFEYFFSSLDGCYYSFDGIGMELVKMISEGLSIDECIENIVANYETNKEMVSSDINEFIKELCTIGLLVKS